MTVVFFIVTRAPRTTRSAWANSNGGPCCTEFRTPPRTPSRPADRQAGCFWKRPRGHVPDFNNLVDDYWRLRLRRSIQKLETRRPCRRSSPTTWRTTAERRRALRPAPLQPAQPGARPGESRLPPRLHQQFQPAVGHGLRTVRARHATWACSPATTSPGATPPWSAWPWACPRSPATSRVWQLRPADAARHSEKGIGLVPRRGRGRRLGGHPADQLHAFCQLDTRSASTSATPSRPSLRLEEPGQAVPRGPAWPSSSKALLVGQAVAVPTRRRRRIARQPLTQSARPFRADATIDHFFQSTVVAALSEHFAADWRNLGRARKYYHEAHGIAIGGPEVFCRAWCSQPQP